MDVGDDTKCAQHAFPGVESPERMGSSMSLSTQLNMLCTPATLVLVPLNLPQQWLSEIEKFVVSQGLRVIQLCSARDAKGVSLQDLCLVDVVITTTNFMRSKTYLDALDDMLRDTFGSISKERKRDQSLLWAAARAVMSAPSRTTFPFVELVCWRRIVVDEVHEFFVCNAAARERRRILKALNAQYWWGLTGTPDRSRSEAVQNYYMFLSPKTISDADGHQHHPCLQSAVEQVLLRSHSTTIHEHSDVVHVIHPTAREHTLFASYDHFRSVDDRIQMMCDPRQLTNGGVRTDGTIEEITESVQAGRSALRQELLDRLDSLAGESDGNDDTRSRKEREKVQKELEAVDRSIAFVGERLLALGRASEACPICMDDRPGCISTCGHLFCESCITKLLPFDGATSDCPVCRLLIRHSDIYAMATNEHDSLGSKLRAVFDFVTERVAAQEKVILFSQWKSPLALLLHHLAARQIPTYHLEGNTSHRTLALRSFRDGPPAVLVLALERSSAGLNLVCASRVVFLHTMIGSIEEATTVESQAVARVARAGQTTRVHAHHFVYRGLEEEVWRARHPERV